MRKGQNPAKQDVPAYAPEKLAIVTLVYIPVEEGYFEHSWEVFLAHIGSVHQTTEEGFNYVVFDNGSCPEVRARLEELHEQGWIDWLILSDQNLGKTGALNFVLGAVPNEWICFADSDMLFRQGWLDESWKIQQAFPNLGMIGAQVIFPDWEVDKGNSAFRKTSDPAFRFSRVKAAEWLVTEYCRGRGINPEKEKIYRQMLLDQVEHVPSGVKAILGGNSHQQWLARREVIRQILPLPAALQLSRKEDTYQDQRLDELGYLHLTTTVPYLYHMGNSIDEEIKPEVARLEIPEGQERPAGEQKAPQKKNLVFRLLAWLSKNKTARRGLVRLYNTLYQIFSSQ